MPSRISPPTDNTNTIAEKIERIIARIRIASDQRKNVQLIAVSKTKPVSLLIEAYHAGLRIFGENKVQEARQKKKTFCHKISSGILLECCKLIR